jgi:hypothetical protein
MLKSCDAQTLKPLKSESARRGTEAPDFTEHFFPRRQTVAAIGRARCYSVGPRLEITAEMT